MVLLFFGGEKGKGYGMGIDGCDGGGGFVEGGVL